MSLSLGIDVGSTTVKAVLLEDENIVFSHYERHMSQVREKTAELLKQPDYLESVYKENALRAAALAERTMEKVRKKVGFVKK